MKKMLTTLMVLALALSAATAMAGDMDWTFYGKVHSSINMLSNGENSQIGLTSNTSRFGFKGNAPMADDFSFVWQFESALNIAQRTGTTLGTRNSYVGIKNAEYGTLLMGIHDSPHKTLGRKTTFFFDTIGDNRQMTFGTDTREGDILAWVSPNWDGFGLFLAYQFDQDTSKLSPTAAADAEFNALTMFSGMATYAKDDFLLGVSTIMMSEGYADDNGASPPVFGDSPMVLRFAGKYDAEQFGFCASYLSFSGQYFDGTDFVDQTATTLGFEGKYNVDSRWSLKAGYYMADPNTDFDNDDYSLITFGIDRNFTKNLQMYLQYAGLTYGDAWDGVGTSGVSDLPALGGGGNGFGKSVRGWYDDSGTTPTVSNPYGISWGLAYKW